MRRLAVTAAISLAAGVLAALPATPAQAATWWMESPAVASAATGTLDTFRVTREGTIIQQNHRSGYWSEPTQLSGGASHGPGAAGDVKAGKLLLAVVGTNGKLWVRTRTGQTWGAWATIGGASNSQPAVASLGGGNFVVVVAGGDSRAWSNTFRAGVWSGWTPRGGQFVEGLSASGTAGGGYVVAGVGTNQQIYTSTVPATGAQTAWASAGNRTYTTPAIAVDPGDGRWHLLAGAGTPDATGPLQERVYNPTTRTWAAWTSFGAEAYSGPAVTASAPGRLDAVFRTIDRGWHTQFGGGTWSAFQETVPYGEYGRISAMASRATSGTQGNGESIGTSVTQDGVGATFQSDATNLVPGDTNGKTDVFFRATKAGPLTRVSVATGGTEGNGDSTGGSTGSGWRYVAFTSAATNLVPGDTNGEEDVFVRDLQSGTTTRVSVATDGTEGNQGSNSGSVSMDGRYVVFQSGANNLSPADPDYSPDTYLRDLTTGTTTVVSVATNGVKANGYSFGEITADGKNVVFGSDATNLVPGDTNGKFDVFVRTLATGVTTRVSVGTGGKQIGAGAREDFSISTSGRFVTFASHDPNIVAGDSNGFADVFLHDRNTGTTTQVSRNLDGAPLNWETLRASVSTTGRYVAFETRAWNVIPRDTNGTSDVFLLDRETSRLYRASLGPSREWGNGESHGPFVSFSGQVLFTSAASNLQPGDNNQARDVFLFEPQ